MRIVQIGPYPIDSNRPMGGVEASVYGLSAELSKEHQIFIIDIPRKSFTIDKTEEKANIKVFRFRLKKSLILFSILWFIKVIYIIRQLKSDICHIHTTSFNFLNIYLLLKYYHIPVIVTVHGLIHKEKRNLWRRNKSFKNLTRYVLGSLTEFIFISICPFIIVDTQYVADTIKIYKKQRKIFRLPVCIVIPQGVHSDFFQMVNNPKSHQLLSVGAFTQRKGHLNLIDSMSKIKSNFPSFSLIIAGSLSNTDYFNLMQKRISQLDLGRNISLFPNASSMEIIDFFRNSEIFILHSEEESQGIVFCEAMATGLPIVATNSGGIPWSVENGKNGLLSDFRDIDTFADNIILLMKDENLRNIQAKNNRLKSHKYQWSNIAMEILDVYTLIS